MIDAPPKRAPLRRRRFWPFGPAPTYDTQLVPLGYEQLAMNAAGQIAWPKEVPDDATRFVLNVEGGSIRYVDSGDSPGVGAGELYAAGSAFSRAIDPRMIQVCQETATAAKVNISYYAVRDAEDY